MDKIQKELLTKDNIRKDLIFVNRQIYSHFVDYKISIVISLIAAIIVFAITKHLWLTLAFSAFTVYFVFAKLIPELRRSKLRKHLLLHGELSLETDELSHFSEQTIYEPYISRNGKRYRYKIVKFFHFDHSEWRVPYMSKKSVFNLTKHYEWSKLYNMSTQGLENTSVVGDTFYIISLKADKRIKYIYNTKLFELKKDEWE